MPFKVPKKKNSLTRKHSTHAYRLSHAHVPHLTHTKTRSRPGELFLPFPRLNLVRGVHPAYFHAVLGQFRGTIDHAETVLRTVTVPPPYLLHYLSYRPKNIYQ